LVMDEPTVHLDYSYQIRLLHLMRRLAQQGYGILMTSHVADHAFLACNRVALLEHGRLHGPGSPAEILTDQALSELYGTTMRVLHVQLPDGPRSELSLCIPLMDGQEGAHDEIEPRDLLRHADQPIVGDGSSPPGV
jgi:iron complex transport system ATP-binding protein